MSSNVLSPSTVEVGIDTYTPSFFGDLLPKGGFRGHVTATAQNQPKIPLCVLVFGDKGGSKLELHDQSSISAPACLVHSDQDINVDPSASLSAVAVQTGGKAKGPITPSAQTDAPTLTDPFLNVDVGFPSACGVSGPGPKPAGPAGAPGPGAASTDAFTTSSVLAAGVHCNNITVSDGATLQLAAGEHYFAGDLTVNDVSRVTDDDVVLVFGPKASFNFTGQSLVSFNGRRSGPRAGFVIAATGDNNFDFQIASDYVSNLLGVIYMPAAVLKVTGSQSVAQASAWTVITALSVQLAGTPGGPGSPGGPLSSASSSHLVVNANYSLSTVPVPLGVGPSGGGSRLVN